MELGLAIEITFVSKSWWSISGGLLWSSNIFKRATLGVE